MFLFNLKLSCAKSLDVLSPCLCNSTIAKKESFIKLCIRVFSAKFIKDKLMLLEWKEMLLMIF